VRALPGLLGLLLSAVLALLVALQQQQQQCSSFFTLFFFIFCEGETKNNNHAAMATVQVCAFCGGPYVAPTVSLACTHRACSVCAVRAFSLECARSLATMPAATSPTPVTDVILRCPLCDIVTRLPREEGVAAILPPAPPVPT
jgi:hypothetical protein